MGFMSGNTALSVYSVPGVGKYFDDGKLRARAFVPEIDAEDTRTGWVGIGDLLDYAFDRGIRFDDYAVFSLRTDTRKPSSAAIKLLLAEAVRDEEQKTGGRVSRARKAELKELITLRVRSRTDYTPSMIDLMIDFGNERLLVSSVSEKANDTVLELFMATFECERPERIYAADPEAMALTLTDLCQGNALDNSGWSVSAYGSADLQAADNEGEKRNVSVKNDTGVIVEALSRGYTLKQARLVAGNSDHGEEVFDFVLNGELAVSGLKFPKWPADKEDPDSEICLRTAFLARASELLVLLCGDRES